MVRLEFDFSTFEENPMGMEMSWAMGAICVLAVIVLLLVGAAAIKYLFFR